MEEKTTKPLAGFCMVDGFVIVEPKKKGELAPEAGKFAIHTFGTVVASSKLHEVGMEIIYDGSQSIKLENMDAEAIPQKAVLAFKHRSDK